MLIAQRAEARGAEQQVSCCPRCEPEPAGGEHPQEMAARKHQHIRGRRSYAAQHAVGPRTDLLRRFTARTAVAEEVPLWIFAVNLGRATPLILTVVPFDECSIDLGNGSEASQVARPRSPLQRTG